MATPYPATRTVAWPSGPVDACDAHAEQMLRIGAKLLGYRDLAVAPCAAGAECHNCRDQAENPLTDGSAN